jgi:phenylpropionate dioxygenase-like ring-hydroxylating dioxygenase large terminal subunit
MSFTAEENETLTRVGPGTLMSDLLSQYWTPALRSGRLVADGAPVRVRLFGRNYVAFRATDGRLGFFDEACPHRGASLALAQNSANGLRCIYHGWKFDVSGTVARVPTESRECAAAFAAGVKLRHYPVREAGGIVWVFLHRDREPPKFPDLEFTHLPDANVDVRVGVFNCNWLQAMESVLDSAHLGQLHRSSLVDAFPSKDPEVRRNMVRILTESPAPQFEIEKTPYGFKEAAIRDLADGNRHVNFRQFVAPYFSLLPTGPDMYRILCISIPNDDEWTSQFFVVFHPYRALTQEELDLQWLYANPDPNDIGGELGSVDDLWGQDRAAMKRGHASGFPQRHVFHEDFITQLSMGAIVDRTQENLGSSDTVIVHTRRELIRAAHALRAGGRPWGLEEPEKIDFSRIRSTNRLLADGEDWRSIDPIAEQERAAAPATATAAA